MLGIVYDYAIASIVHDRDVVSIIINYYDL